MEKITSIDQLKVGMDIISPSNEKEHIYAICGELVWLQACPGSYVAYSIDDLQSELYTVEEPKWEPKEEEIYFFPNLGAEDLCSNTFFSCNFETCRERKKNGLCFRTKEEAIAAAEKMLKALKNE